MKVSTRARYGIRAMLDLAINGEDGKPVLLKDIAERQAISKRYLEHMMTDLRKNGLVQAERGVGGGYWLGRPASKIRLDELFEVLEGEISPVECLGDPSICDRTIDCVTRELWTDMAASMRRTLKKRTLEDLKNRWREVHCSSGRQVKNNAGKKKRT